MGFSSGFEQLRHEAREERKKGNGMRSEAVNRPPEP